MTASPPDPSVTPVPLPPVGDPRRGAAADLPIAPTPLIGRKLVLADISALLGRDDVRLVTLTGPGGSGKTRLAVHAAQLHARDFADGVVFVSLAPILEPGLVTPTIAQAVGLLDLDSKSLVERLSRFLRQRQVLLVLDNFEQVLAAAPGVSDLLAASLRTKVLVTSRSVLRLSGEHVLAVPPLSLPVAGGEWSLPEVASSESVRLFVARAQASRADFVLTAGNAGEVAEICHRLDGLPLAIELAAARTAHLPIAALLQRLDHRLPLLINGPRDQPARLRTMRDAIGWSYELLSPDERVLFRRLAVFVGGFTLEAAARVGAMGHRDRDVLDGVAALVEQSLLQLSETAGGAPRYRMLETVREYGLARLAEHGEEAAVRDQHANYFVELADQAQMVMWIPGGEIIAQRLEADLPNLRSCVAWLKQARDAEPLLQFVGALMGFMAVRGNLREGLVWLEQAVALGRDTGAPSLAGGIISLAAVVHLRGDERRGLALAEEGIELARVRNDDFAVARGLIYAGLAALRRCELEQAAAFQREALALVTELGDTSWVQLVASSILGHLGNIAIGAGDVDQADACFAAALARQRALGYEPGTSHIHASHPLAGLGDVARARGDQTAALARYQEALRHAWRFRDTRAIAYALGGVASALAAAGRWESAARLFGAAEALHEQAGLPFDLETMNRQRALGLPEPWQRADDSFGSGQPLRDALGRRVMNVAPAVPDTAAAVRTWGEGRALPLADAVAEAVSVTIPAGPIRPGSSGLTSRELDVLRLVAAGSSNAQIAEALFISVPTVKRHLTNLLGKLGLPSRSAAAAYAHRHHLI